MLNRRLLLLLLVPALAATATADHYTIRSISYSVDGTTRAWALAEILPFAEGDTFASRQELAKAVGEGERILQNQRVLAEARVSYHIVDDATSQDDGHPVDVTVAVRDTWNVVVLPYFKYDSNEGALVSLRGRNYNFLGTLEPLALNLDYQWTETGESIWVVDSSLNLPLRVRGTRWRILFDQNVSLEGGVVDSRSTVSLANTFDLLAQPVTAQWSQVLRFLSADESGDWGYTTSRASLSSSIALPVSVGAAGPLSFAPSVSAAIDYRPGGISEERDGVYLSFGGSLGARRVDWSENIRDGAAVSLGVSAQQRLPENTWDTRITASSSSYWAGPLARGGLSARVSGFYLVTGPPPDQSDGAAAIRGVLNNQLRGDLGIFLNMDLIGSIFTIPRLAEGQVVLFSDFGLVHDTRGYFGGDGTLNPSEEFRTGAGIEVLGFPLFARSFYVRGSLGFDILRLMTEPDLTRWSSRELFIGIGHHY